jgi:hypothetical protein
VARLSHPTKPMWMEVGRIVKVILTAAYDEAAVWYAKPWSACQLRFGHDNRGGL